MLSPSLTTIKICDLCVFGHHGVWEEENKLGQKFFLNFSVTADMNLATKTDSYENALCYGSLCQIAEDVVKHTQFNLIETLAEHLAQKLFKTYPMVVETEIEISKPSAPIQQAISTVKVLIKRKRHAFFGLSLGSNIGHRETFLETAIEHLKYKKNISIETVSSFYDSKPWGVTDQPAFVNMALTGHTTLSPYHLLDICKTLELTLGRTPSRRWGERVIDIDLLFYDNMKISKKMLTLPHPEIMNRAFVLEPLIEIAPELTLSGKKISDILNHLPREKDDVIRRPNLK